MKNNSNRRSSNNKPSQGSSNYRGGRNSGGRSDSRDGRNSEGNSNYRGGRNSGGRSDSRDGRNSEGNSNYRGGRNSGGSSDSRDGRSYDDNRKLSSDRDANPEKLNDNENSSFIYGKHAIKSALEENKEINKVWLFESFRDKEIVDLIKDYNVPFKFVNKNKLDSFFDNKVTHQGVVASISQKEYTDFHELVELADKKPVFYLILDKIEDPHNLGAIIRTASAVNVDAIIMPKNRSVPVTGTVVKVSAGAIDRIKVCRVTNLVDSIKKLKEKNIWVGAVDMDGETVYSKANLKGNIALVLGGEGKGVSRLVKETCDFTVSIPMTSDLESLNVSVASALVMYEVYKQKNYE